MLQLISQRRIWVYLIGKRSIEKIGDDSGIERVATDEAVRPKLPEIAGLATRWDGIRLRKAVIRRIARLRRHKAFDQLVDLGDREAGDIDAEIDIGLHQLFQFQCEHLEMIIQQHLGCDDRRR
jgi:hypothetical protein